MQKNPKQIRIHTQNKRRNKSVWKLCHWGRFISIYLVDFFLLHFDYFLGIFIISFHSIHSLFFSSRKKKKYNFFHCFGLFFYAVCRLVSYWPNSNPKLKLRLVGCRFGNKSERWSTLRCKETKFVIIAVARLSNFFSMLISMFQNGSTINVWCVYTWMPICFIIAEAHPIWMMRYFSFVFRLFGFSFHFSHFKQESSIEKHLLFLFIECSRVVNRLQLRHTFLSFFYFEFYLFSSPK